ncbi:MAG: hypothetical protein JXR86_02145 [Spirochaetales bacterium]|nr:hypothetical protein [Spirochaetales bacterium]
MKLVTLLLAAVLLPSSLYAQTSIPEDFWTSPIQGINLVLSELYAATQGQTIEPFSMDPTPDILFNKVNFRIDTQMDGTVVKTVKGKTSLSGNTVSFELLTYQGASLVIKSVVSVFCNLQAKQNKLVRLQIIPADGNSIDLSVASYDLYGDPIAANNLAQFFTVYSQLFYLWYDYDSVEEYLRQ